MCFFHYVNKLAQRVIGWNGMQWLRIICIELIESLNVSFFGYLVITVFWFDANFAIRKNYETFDFLFYTKKQHARTLSRKCHP